VIVAEPNIKGHKKKKIDASEQTRTQSIPKIDKWSLLAIPRIRLVKGKQDVRPIRMSHSYKKIFPDRFMYATLFPFVLTPISSPLGDTKTCFIHEKLPHI